MPRFNMRIKDKYFCWSTIVDAPITHGMTVEEYRKWYIFEYGNIAYDEQKFNNMISALDKNASVYGNGIVESETIEDAILCNRAGENEAWITADEIYERYS